MTARSRQRLLSFDDFLETPPGQELLRWEALAFASAVEDAFGFEALQVGTPAIDSLAENRILSRWLLVRKRDTALVPLGRRRCVLGEAARLPIATESMDLVTLPHVLDTEPRPAEALAEAVRVLRPEGMLVITALSHLGLWALRERLRPPFLPESVKPQSVGSVREQLRSFGLEVNRGRFGLYAPALKNETAFRSWSWIEKAGDRWAPQCANLFMLCAVKHKPGMRPLKADPLKLPAEVLRGSKIPVASNAPQQSTQAKEPAP